MGLKAKCNVRGKSTFNVFFYLKFKFCVLYYQLLNIF